MRLLPRKFCRSKQRRLKLLQRLGRPEYFGYLTYRLLQEQDYATSTNYNQSEDDEQEHEETQNKQRKEVEEAIRQYTIDRKRTSVGKTVHNQKTL